MEKLLTDIYAYVEDIADGYCECDIYGQEGIDEARKIKKLLEASFPSLFKTDKIKDGGVGEW